MRADRRPLIAPDGRAFKILQKSTTPKRHKNDVTAFRNHSPALSSLYRVIWHFPLSTDTLLTAAMLSASYTSSICNVTIGHTSHIYPALRGNQRTYRGYSHP